MYDFNIKNSINNESITGFFLVKSIAKEKAKNNSYFLNIMLSNKQGDILCRLWNCKDEDFDFFSNNDIVKVKATVNEFQGTKQLIINKYRCIDESDNIDINRLVESSSIDSNDVYDKIYNTALNFKNKTLQLITTTILKDNESQIKIVGAAKLHHHNIVSGWLEHTFTMLEDAKMLAKKYDSNLNEDLLYAGTILHDIGKLKELSFKSYGIVDGYTVEGELLGHITLGIQILMEYTCKLKPMCDFDWDNNIMVLLNHMILSHHGQPEYGSPRYPMIKEAEILSSLDMLDTKMFMFDKIISDTNENDFSQRQWSLNNRKIYNKID